MRRQKGNQLLQIVHRLLSHRTEGELNIDDNQEVVVSPEVGQSLKEDNVTNVIKNVT
jgi:hypothetical protein